MKNLDRRAFLKSSGLAVLTVTAVPAAFANNSCRLPRDEENKRGPKGVTVRSEGCLLVEHHHELYIPYALLRDPPSEGVKLSTGWAKGHYHSVPLTHADLYHISMGHEVFLVDSTIGEHSFTVRLSMGVPERDGR